MSIPVGAYMQDSVAGHNVFFVNGIPVYNEDSLYLLNRVVLPVNVPVFPDLNIFSSVWLPAIIADKIAFAYDKQVRQDIGYISGLSLWMSEFLISDSEGFIICRYFSQLYCNKHGLMRLEYISDLENLKKSELILKNITKPQKMNYRKNQGKFILAIDQSTSATKVMLFDASASLVHRVGYPHRQFYPAEGFVEHDPEEIFANTVKGMNEVLRQKGVYAADLAVISITNQRETSLIWDKTTGKPISNAAVWQCQRGREFCQKLNNDGFGPKIREKTGLIVDPYFSASKLRWIIQNVEGVRGKAKNGDLLLGTIDCWLLWKLTGGKVHATDYSNACRTMLFNIHTLKWDEELLSLFDLVPSMFPEVRYSDQIFGETDPSVVFDIPVPVAGVLGDSHAALFGQNCFEPGMAKATYGTGSSIMMNIGPRPLPPPEGLCTSIGYGRSGRVDYVFEGNIHCTGDTISWLVNDAELISSVAESEQLALSVSDNNQVYFVPSFVGLGAPWWDNRARACISGMARNTKKAHIVRAALESIAYQVKDLIGLMAHQEELDLKELRVDGGPTRNNFLMQFQSDILGKPVIRSGIEEISALGSAFMAGLTTGFWKNLDEIKGLYHSDRVFLPEMDKPDVETIYKGWKKAVERTRL